jgi:tRNA A-37 threonylcarbamoyl transferase component Bud32
MADLDASKNVSQIDWEAFYANYRKPDYVPGYEIAQKLGAGAFGIVFKARKHSIGKDYAIKFLKVDDAAVRDAVLHELSTVRLFAQIDHPNLVSIEDMGHVSGIPFIVMGYAGEETLARRLEAGRLARDEALRIFVQVSRGVHALHERMLVHFDLKPANVYLRGDTARVGDYGLSKLVTASRRSLSFGRGTTYYMAPEVLHRKGDQRSDIYSLGVMLYECLVGRVPFQGDTEWEILKKHETQAPEYPPDLAPSDRAVLEACLAKDPDDRVQSVPEMLALLQGTAAAPARRQAPAAPATRALRETMVFPAAARQSVTNRRWLAVVAVTVLFMLAPCLWFSGRATGPATAFVTTTIPAPAYPLAAAPRAPLAPRDTPDEVEEFQNHIDNAIAALQRLRQVDVSSPEVRRKALSALGATLRNFDLKGFKGQDPIAEAILQAVQSGLKSEEVRDRWSEVVRSLLAPAGENAKSRRQPAR